MTEEEKPLPRFTRTEVAQHRNSESAWVIIEDKIFDVTQFLDEHPGGAEVLLEQAGQDATESFDDVGHSSDAREIKKEYMIGELAEVYWDGYQEDKKSKPAKSTTAVKVDQNIFLSPLGGSDAINTAAVLTIRPFPKLFCDLFSYGGKVRLARRKKPDPFWLWGLQLIAILVMLFLCYYSYYYIDNFVFHINKIYAHLGHTEAKHGVGQRYLQGIGVSKDHKKAMQWFQKAANDGHPQASYNLAVAHLKGHSKLPDGEAHKLIKHAAANGVREAYHLLRDVCTTARNCD